MKKKVLVLSVILGLMFTYLVSARTVSAYWFLDFLKGGRVKGEQTTNSQSQIRQYFQNMMHRFSGNGEDGSRNGQTGESEDGQANQGSGQFDQQVTPTGQVTPGQEGQSAIPESRINQLVAAGRLTSSQGTQLIARLRAIKAKRDELKALEQELVAWFRSNSLDTRMFGRQQNPTVTPETNEQESED